MSLSPNRRLCLLSVAAFFLAKPAQALDGPKGKVVLSVSGNIKLKTAGDLAKFDMDMLAALPQHSFLTMTPWYPERK